MTAHANSTRQTLSEALARVIPDAELDTVSLPDSRGLELHLLQESYPQHRLEGDAVVRIMDEPMYWAFCWAAGQSLACFLLENPGYLKGRRVLDFGTGSGVVAIAAALGGAGSVVACDTDPLAREACLLNASHNNVGVEVIGGLDELAGPLDLILAADVLYDRSNLDWLGRFLDRAPQVLLADSRIKDFNFHGYQLLETRHSHTLPDLDESQEFREVKVYLGERPRRPEENLAHV